MFHCDWVRDLEGEVVLVSRLVFYTFISKSRGKVRVLEEGWSVSPELPEWGRGGDRVDAGVFVTSRLTRCLRL